MALVKCTECGREFSDKASACPQCAAPLAAVEAPLVITELQSKRIKTHKLMAALMMIVGLVMAFGAASAGAQSSAATVGIGTLLFLAGGVYWFVTRFRSWWHHG